jgi:hypothetical protein
MGAMTLNDFQQELIARGFNMYTPAQLATYINWGQRKVARKSRWTWEKTVGTFNLAPGAYSYDLIAQIPSFKSLRRLYVISPNVQKKLEPADEKIFDERWLSLDLAATQNRGEPQEYFIEDNLLYVVPPPNQSRDFRIHFFQRAVDLVNGNDKSVVPADLDQAVLLAALMECHRRANEPEMMALAKIELDDMLNDMLTEEEFISGETQDRTRPDDTWA